MGILSSAKRTRSSWIRLLADSLMVTMSFALSMVLRYLWMVVNEDIAPAERFTAYVRCFLVGLPVLLASCMFFFRYLGFYTKGRSYRSRFKVFIVWEGVTLGYVTTGFLAFFVGKGLWFPRGALVISYVVTAAIMILSRVWSTLWRTIIREEEQVSSTRVSAGPDEKKRVLVIGGAGYIGSALVPKLLDSGYRVRILDLMLYGEEPIRPYMANPDLEILRQDFRQVDVVVQSMRGVDSLVHLGAIVGDPACAIDEDLTKEINLMATKVIADVARGIGVEKFVFASTCSVYGASDDVLDEHSVLNPVSLYARTKVACEKVLVRMADDKFRPTVLRFSTIYGLSGRTRFDLVVNLLTAKALGDGEITVSGGDQWRPFIHVDDAALAILNAVRAPLEQVGNEILNVGSNEQNYTIDQAAEFIRQEVPGATIKEIPFEGDRRNYRVDFAKLERTLQFQPRWTIEKGIKQVADAIRSGEIEDYRDPIYSNVMHLSRKPADKLMSREMEWLEEQLMAVPKESL